MRELAHRTNQGRLQRLPSSRQQTGIWHCLGMRSAGARDTIQHRAIKSLWSLNPVLQRVEESQETTQARVNLFHLALSLSQSLDSAATRTWLTKRSQSWLDNVYRYARNCTLQPVSPPSRTSIQSLELVACLCASPDQVLQCSWATNAHQKLTWEG